MSDTSRLPIDIVVSVDKASVGVAFADLEAKAASVGRKIGQGLGRGIATEGLEDGSKAFKKAMAEILKDGKAKADELYRINSIQQSRDIQTWQEGVKAFQSAEKAKSAAAKQAASDRANREALQQSRDIQTWQEGVKAFQSAEKAKSAAAKQAADERSRIQAIQEKRDYESYVSRNKPQVSTAQAAFKTSSIRSPQDVANELASLREAKKAWEAMGPATEGYNGALAQIASKTNILTEGNARARGSFHKMTAAIASLTFEITGALYGLAAIGTATAGGAIFGITFLKSIEDAKHGIAATLTAMSGAAGVQMSYAQSSAIASQEIAQLNKNSIKYNVSLEDIAKTYQAIIGPGMAAGMTLKEIGQIATIGTVAVKSLALDSRQVIQEIRDLVQGGIQAASSTLATALGLKDKDINDAKKSAEGLFTFLEKRLSGYVLAAAERQNTLTGSWDVLKIKVQRLFSDESGFNAFKEILNKISNAIGEIDYKTGEIKFNPELLKTVESYWTSLKAVGTLLGVLIEYTIKLAPYVLAVGTAFLSFKAGTVLIPLLSGAMDALIAKLTITPVAIKGIEVATESMYTKFSKLSLATKGGIIGLVIWGLYEAADYFGLIDSIFKTAENRAKSAYDKIKAMGSVGEVEGELGTQQRKLERMKLSKDAGIGTRIDVFGFKGALNETNMQREIIAQERLVEATRSNVDKLRQIEKDRAGAETNMQFAQATQSLAKDSASIKDAIGIRAEFSQKSAELAKKLEIAKTPRYGETPEEAAKSQEIRLQAEKNYSRAMIDITKKRDKDLAALNKPDAGAGKAASDAYAKQSAEINDAINAGTITFTQAYEKRRTVLQGYIDKKINITKFEGELSKITLEFYKVEASQIDESVADGVRSYSEGYDAKVALIESFKNKSISAATAEIETNNLRIKLAKDSTAAMKDIDAATAKYADTLSDGARYEKDFLDATKNKVDIMEKELDVLKSLSDPTEEQRKKMEALTVSLAGYKVAVVEVTDVLKPLLDAMQNIDKLKITSDIQIETLKQQPLDLAVGGSQELTPIEQSGIDLAIYENRNQLLRNANAELAIALSLNTDIGTKTGETAKKYEEALKKVAGIRKEVEGYAKAINLSKAYGDQFYNAFNKSAILFGKLGKSIADVAGGVGNLVGISKTYSKSMEDAAKISDDIHDPKRIEVEQKAYTKMSEESIDAYANIAGAAKSMFEENTAGYKIMEAVEKGFRAFQLAASIASIAQGWAETAASTTQSATKATGSTIAGAAKAFEQMGVYGFIGAAAIIAFMAAMGSGGASAGGGMPAIPQEATAEYQQSIQGTGTVLGDSTAQSETIANGIEILSQHSFEMLDFTQGMLSALKRIDGGISNLASSLAKISGITGVGGVSAFGTVEKSSSDPGFLGIGASTSETEIINTGIYIRGTVAALTDLNGVLEQFETTATSWTESGFWGIGSDSGTDISTQTKAITGEAVTQIGMIFGSMSDSIREGIDLLGMAADSSELEALMTTIGNIPIDLSASLQGLSGEDITNALNGVFSAAFDNMVSAIMPYAKDFQQIGEGVGETFIRLASNARTLELSLKSMGMSFPDVTEYAVTHQPTQADIDRYASAQRSRDEAAANLEASQAIDKAKTPDVTTYEVVTSGDTLEYVQHISAGIAEASQATIDASRALITAEEDLADARLAASTETLDMSHKLTIAREYLIEGAGGIDAFVESAQFFNEAFISESTRMDAVLGSLKTAFTDMSAADEATGRLAGLGLQLAELGYAIPTTRDEFAKIVTSLDLTSTAGADLYNSMMSVAPAFDAFIGYLDDLIEAAYQFDLGMTDRIFNLTGEGSASSKIKTHGFATYDKYTKETDPTRRLELINSMVGDVDAWLSATQREIDDATNRQVKSVQTRIDFLEKEKQAITDANNIRIDALNIELDLANQWVGVLETAKGMIESMRLTAENPLPTTGRLALAESDVATLQAKYASATGQAKVDYAKDLLGALNSQLDLAKEAYQRPSQEYQDQYNSIIMQISEIEAYAQTQADLALVLQEELNTLTEANNLQLIAINNEIASANAQIIAIQESAVVQQEAANAQAAEWYRYLQEQGNAIYEDELEKTITQIGLLSTQVSLLEAIYGVIGGDISSLPGHADGLAFVPYDNYVARLHSGERVLTSDENRVYSEGRSSDVTVPITINVNGSGLDASTLTSVIQQTTLDLVPEIKRRLEHA